MKGLGFPCMSPDTNDYLDPDGYSVALQQASHELHVCHRIRDADSLPGQWLREARAVFACEIRAPYMLYCQRHAHVQPPQAAQGGLEARQIIPYPETQDKAIYFMPAVVLQEDVTVDLNAAHGVSSLWQGRTVSAAKGAVLAGGEVFEDMESVVNLMEFRLDNELADGIVQSAVEEYDDQWRLVVSLPRALWDELRKEQLHRDWRNALYVGCLARMLTVVKENYAEEEPPHEALKVLGKMIEEDLGVAPPWMDEGNPWEDTLRLATSLHKLLTPQAE